MTNASGLKGIKAVFFDVFNTLARYWPPREEIQAQACREFGITVTAQGITKGYAAADAYLNQINASSNPLRTQSTSMREMFFARYEQMILEGAGVTVDLVRAGDIWRHGQAIPYGLALFDDVLPTLHKLKERRFTLGVISNMNRDGRALGKDLGLDGVVHFVVTSFEVQSEKPHPTIFKEALRRAGVAAQDATHVGDQMESDIQGARNVGIRPILIDRYGTNHEDAGCPRISTMGELEALLPKTA